PPPSFADGSNTPAAAGCRRTSNPRTIVAVRGAEGHRVPPRVVLSWRRPWVRLERRVVVAARVAGRAQPDRRLGAPTRPSGRRGSVARRLSLGSGGRRHAPLRRDLREAPPRRLERRRASRRALPPPDRDVDERGLDLDRPAAPRQLLRRDQGRPPARKGLEDD